MKTLVSFGIILISSVFLGCEDQFEPPVIPDQDEQTDVPPVALKSTVNFASPAITVSEGNPSPIDIVIRLSRPAAEPGKVVILVDGLDQLIIEPSLLNDHLSLVVTKGDSVLKFTARPVNDDVVTGHSTATFIISSVEGSIEKGNVLSQQLNVQDDELVSKLKSYETVGANDLVKRVYEYDAKGRISKVHWETQTPYKREGTDTWFYDDNDRLVKINKYPGRDLRYVWDGNKIYMEEEYKDGELVKYTVFAYDPKGNVGGSHPFYKQSDGTFHSNLFFVYLYFNDGNIYKALTYTQQGEEEPVLLSTKTYENYAEKENTIPMIQILPTVKSQRNLPTSYRVEENGFDFQYTLRYEFRNDGLLWKRIATTGTMNEVTTYEYY